MRYIQTSLSQFQYQKQRHSFVLAAFLVSIFALISLFGTPFLYDRANSGRYLLQVIQAMDPELFAQDPIVESLQRFGSLFYDILAVALQVTETDPDRLESVIFGLYVGYKFALFLGLFILARRLSDNIWLFILIAAWAAHQKAVPVGGARLFESQITHASVAFVLCLFALWALLSHKHFLYWMFCGLAVLVHSIIGLQFVLITAPVYWYIQHHVTFEAILGGIVFVASLAIYYLYMTPPAMALDEAAIFLQVKGSINHISPFNHSWIDWLRVLAGLGLSILAYHVFLRDSEPAQLLMRFIITGTVLAVLLGTVAVVFQPVRLAQFQPMRIFFWVWFFVQIILLLSIVSAFSQDSPAAPLLLGVLLMDISVSLWSSVFIVFCLLYLALRIVLARYQTAFLPTINLGTRWSVVIIFMGIIGGNLISRLLDLEIGSLRASTPLLLSLLLVLMVFIGSSTPRWQSLILAVMLVIALTRVSLYRHSYYAARLDPAFEKAQLWSREHTKKNERFITTPDVSGNFRTKAFRTSVSEPMSALCWIDPFECKKNGAIVAQVNSAKIDDVWHISTLTELASQWDAQYILLSGAYISENQPIYDAEEYTIFRVPK